MKVTTLAAVAAPTAFALLVACAAGAGIPGGMAQAVAATTGGGTQVAVAAVVAPAITTQPVSQAVATGESATFSVVASGTSPKYRWYKDGTLVSGATGSSYTIGSAAASDAGVYRVRVSNSAGAVVSDGASLTVTDGAGSLAAAATSAAQAFMATLSSSQQASVQLAWSLDTARHWSNLPASMVSRNGLNWGSLGTAQQAAARTLIATALGPAGNTLHLGLQKADNYLYANGGGSSYGAGKYYIAFLGTPSATGFWVLQLTGHHLTYNIAFNGSAKSPTPMFLGIEPKASFTTGGTTYDPMQSQREAFSSLGTALTGYPAAKLSGTYSDLLFGANGSGSIDATCPRSYASVTEHGMAYANLSAAHQALVQAAIKAYVDTQATEYADDLLAAYLGSSALASTYVAYAGTGTVTANGNYFRIEGPRLWIEFSVQRGVIFSSDIHYHTIWRDKTGDYGGSCVS